MKRAFTILVCALAFAAPAFSQSASDPNDGARIRPDDTVPGAYILSWWSKSGWSYLFQESEDMIAWRYCPGIIFTGTGAPDSICFQLSGDDHAFLRLKRINVVAATPYLAGQADFDGDKVSNDLEFFLGTDPLDFTDTDGDGMPDDWEFRFGLNKMVNTDAGIDRDGDGLTNLAEFTAGSDPTDYYNANSYGDLPAPSLISGSQQEGYPGTFSAQPIVVELRNGANLALNAPVTVMMQDPNSGQISQTNDGTGLATTLSLTTDATTGRVQLYFRHPDAIPATTTTRIIDFRVGSAVAGGQFRLVNCLAYTRKFYNYPPGSLGLHLSNAIDGRLAATLALVSPATAKPVFTTQDHSPLPPAQPTYVRNTASWCYNLRQAMTCISPWNDRNANFRSGTAITQQHLITSAHFPLYHDDTVRFITADNVVVEGTVRGVAVHPSYVGASNNYQNDLTVYTLEAPLPTTITPCKVLPANYANYLSYLEVGRPPAMLLDQSENASVCDLHDFNISAQFQRPNLRPDRLAFNQEMTPGASSNPAFLIINNSLVLLTTLTHGGFYPDGTFVTPQISTLNAMIATADADAATRGYPLPPEQQGQTVQTIDLSGFDAFTPP